MSLRRMVSPGLIMAATLWTSPAWAQDGASAMGWTVAFLVLLVAALALGIASLLLRKQTEDRAKMLENAAGTLLALAGKSPDAYLLVHSDARLVVSDRLREWLDLPFAPRHLADLGPGETGGGLNADSFQRLLGSVKSALEGGEGRTQIKCRTQNQERSLAANVLRWDDPAGQPVALCWLRDITEIEGVLAENQAGQGSLKAALHATRTLVEKLEQPIWWRDSQTGDIIDANKAYLDVTESQSLSDVLDSQIELAGKTEKEAQRALALEVAKTDQPAARGVKVVVNGERRSFWLNEIPLGPSLMGGIALDQTQSLEMEEELERFSQSQNEILNMLSSAVAVFGPEQRLIFFNTAFSELSGISAASLAEQPRHSDVLEQMRENQRLPEQANFLAWKTKQLEAYTSLLEPEVDTWHLLDDTTLRVVTQPHPFGGILLLLEDVTDRLALERSYNTLITVQDATLNNLSEATAVFGADGELKLHNKVFEDLWSLSGAFLAKRPRMSDLSAHLAEKFEIPDAAKALTDSVIRSTVARTPAEERAFLKDGRVIDYRAVPLPDGAALLTCSDVTASVEVENALRERAAALLAADKVKSEFVTNMSYELRTPLTSIIGFAEILDQQFFGDLNDKQTAYTQDILASSNRLLDMIDGILDLAVSETGMLHLDIAKHDVATFLSDVVGRVRPKSERKAIEIETKWRKNIGKANFDARRIRQALTAVLQNAIRYTPGGGTIEFSTTLKDGALTMKVADGGPGISEEDRALAFERFQRGSNASGAKGTGLGLAIARQFFAIHGGTIEIENYKDGERSGAVVTMVLPTSVTEVLAAE